MADTTYTSGVTVISADTMNDLNRLHYTIFADPADAAAARTAIGLTKTVSTFTPALSFSSGSVTYSVQEGSYQRLGDSVIATGRLYISAISSPTGDVRLTGLPIASSNRYYSVSLCCLTSAAETATPVRAALSNLSTEAILYKPGSSRWQGTDILANTDLIFTVSYLI